MKAGLSVREAADETGWVRAPGEFLRDAISRPSVKASSPT